MSAYFEYEMEAVKRRAESAEARVAVLHAALSKARIRSTRIDNDAEICAALASDVGLREWNTMKARAEAAEARAKRLEAVVEAARKWCHTTYECENCRMVSNFVKDALDALENSR